ncbi:MAG TPA: FAD-binding protein [Gemmatimonadaceae bacterium]|nr:FAD-binding protein [Gemmatimonadaceae bacterium]
MTTIMLDSVEAVRDTIREAASRGISLRIVGRGTWLDAGRPVHASGSVSTRDLAGIVDYVPGDLTLTARAGTSLAEIRAATAEHNQWLALDPFGSDDGTVGATVATASAGPLATFFGTPRDLVLGIEFVTGGATVARGGGRVVKNVAGFDITRLLTGSWGTLGVITEVTLRLHARPEADVSFAVSIGGTENDLSRLRETLRRLPFTPYACEAVNSALARALQLGDHPVALFRLGGNMEAVSAQRAALVEVGETREIDGDVWHRLRHAEPGDAFVFRLSRRPAQIGATWTEAMDVARACPGTLVHCAPARGTARCIVPPRSGLVQTLSAVFASAQSSRIGERLSDDVWAACFPPPRREIDSRIKAAFDPTNVLNPGLLGEVA